MSNVTIASLPRIDRDKLATLVRAKSSSLTVIDVRDSDYIGGHIVGGINVPTNTHDYKMPELARTLKDKDTVVFHCALSQQRGPSAALKYMRERERLFGPENVKKGNEGATREKSEAKTKDEGVGEAPEVKGQTVYVLEGGFVQWQEASVLLDRFPLTM